jgi:hypothetical protein
VPTKARYAGTVDVFSAQLVMSKTANRTKVGSYLPIHTSEISGVMTKRKENIGIDR